MRLLPAFLGHRAAISIIVAVLAVGAAVGAFASQDAFTGASEDTVATETDDGDTDDGTVVEDETDGDGDETDTDTTDGTTDETTDGTDGDTETDGTTDETTDETDGDTGETEGEAETDTEVEDGDEEDVPREIVGIPDDNPNFEPENGDGICDKFETVVKTTPSGKQVNVPCHAVERGPPSFSKGQKGGPPVEDGDDLEDEEEEEEEVE